MPAEYSIRSHFGQLVANAMLDPYNSVSLCEFPQKPATNVVRAALTLALWAGIMTAGNDNMVEALSTTYNIILKVRIGYALRIHGFLGSLKTVSIPLCCQPST